MTQPLNPLLYLILLTVIVLNFACLHFWRQKKIPREVLLLASSLVVGAIFYPAALFILGICGLFTVLLSGILHRASRQPRARVLLLWPMVISAIVAMALARSPWFGKSIWPLISRLFEDSSTAGFIAVSYFLLRALSLWFDLYKCRLTEAPTLLGTLNYLLFFPTLVSGPIDRYGRFRQNFTAPPLLDASVLEMVLWRGVLGLFKKVVLADSLISLAYPAGPGALQHLQSMSCGEVWVAFYAYAARIYLDFSGYSDLAIAMGLSLGVRVPENFNAPYLARNITEFWRRWHITLSEWLRDYIFLPTGLFLTRGMLRGQSISAGFCAAFLAFSLCGLWHGLEWHFLIWGMMHGIWVFGHKIYMDWVRSQQPSALFPKIRESIGYHGAAVILTFHGVAFSWVWFAAPSVPGALLILKKMAGIT